LDEDREAIEFDMERAGFGPEIKAKAMEIADAAARIIESNFTEGYEQLDAVKRKYGDEPWFKSETDGQVSPDGRWLAYTTETHKDDKPQLIVTLNWTH
jgi:hypothetical protein